MGFIYVKDQETTKEATMKIGRLINETMIKKLHDKGFSNSDIANIMDLHESSILNYLK